MTRIVAVAGALLIAATALTGCTNTPEPAEPTWTQESAYAAAEETFRAFTEAAYDEDSNTVDFVIGDMVALEREAAEMRESAALEIRGAVSTGSFSATNYRRVGDEVALDATACVDATEVEVRTRDHDWQQPREVPLYGVHISFASSKGVLFIDDFYDSVDVQC